MDFGEVFCVDISCNYEVVTPLMLGGENHTPTRL